MMAPALIVGFSLSILFFFPFIIYVGCMVHVHTIKFFVHIVLGTPPPILVISSNLALLFLDVPVFKVGNYLNITIVGFPFFLVSM